MSALESATLAERDGERVFTISLSATQYLSQGIKGGDVDVRFRSFRHILILHAGPLTLAGEARANLTTTRADYLLTPSVT